MANRSALIVSLFFFSAILIQETEAGIISDVATSICSAIEYVLTSVESILKEIIDPPRNSNSSIVYALYTPDSPQDPCFLEQNNKALERCPFNSTYPLKFLIHGFLSKEPLNRMKNRFLELYEYNIVVMDWTRYNQPPYLLAAVNTLFIGHELANMIQFLEHAKGVYPQNVHLIGHSLGAHVAGVAGKETANLSRISGLDPAVPLFSSRSILHRLTYTDAGFVDVIHTSTKSLIGFGIQDPIGHQDFYPNGDFNQPQCVNNPDSETTTTGQTTANSDDNLDEENLEGIASIDVNICDHSAATEFYRVSINECPFLSVSCDSFEDFEAGKCSNGSNILTEMGYPAHQIPGLPPKTKFYLRTSASKPYCLKYGYEPK